MQVLFNFGKSFVGSHMFTLGLLYILSSLSRASKEKQHRSWRWSSWLRVSWAALPGWFVATGLRFLSEGPFRGRLAGCHGAGLLAQSTIPGTAGKDQVYFLSFCFIWLLTAARPDVTFFLVLCQGDMELALESYDVCIGLLQSKPKTPEGKLYTINLPNLRVDAAISVEEVSADWFLHFSAQ